MESLEVIRQDYRKNSVKSSNSCVQSEDEEEFWVVGRVRKKVNHFKLNGT